MAYLRYARSMKVCFSCPLLIKTSEHNEKSRYVRSQHMALQGKGGARCAYVRRLCRARQRLPVPLNHVVVTNG